MAGQDWFEKDFYAVLGVPQDASADVIKKAYRKLARQHHPDSNGGESASEERFKEVGEAYGVLSDPEQRQQYDAVRAMSRGGARFTAGGPNGGQAGFEDLLGGLFGGAGGAGGPGGRNVRFGAPGRPGGAAGQPDLEDLLAGMFGGAGGFSGGGAGGQTGFRAPRGPRRGEDLAANVDLTFHQAVEGSQLSLRVEDPRTGSRTINARVPAGVRDGQKVRLRGKGRPGDPGGEDGDLVVTVHVEPHPLFSIDGDNLKITVPITFPEATLGAQIEVPTADGSTVRVKVAAGTPSGRILRVKGRGVKGGKHTGDLLITVQVVVPQRLDPAAKQAVDAFAAATSGIDPRAELLAKAHGDRAAPAAGSAHG